MTSSEIFEQLRSCVISYEVEEFLSISLYETRAELRMSIIITNSPLVDKGNEKSKMCEETFY